MVNTLGFFKVIKILCNSFKNRFSVSLHTECSVLLQIIAQVFQVERISNEELDSQKD